jgi:hypothetical protein
VFGRLVDGLLTLRKIGKEREKKKTSLYEINAHFMMI